MLPVYDGYMSYVLKQRVPQAGYRVGYLHPCAAAAVAADTWLM